MQILKLLRVGLVAVLLLGSSLFVSPPERVSASHIPVWPGCPTEPLREAGKPLPAGCPDPRTYPYPIGCPGADPVTSRPQTNGCPTYYPAGCPGSHAAGPVPSVPDNCPAYPPEGCPGTPVNPANVCPSDGSNTDPDAVDPAAQNKIYEWLKNAINFMSALVGVVVILMIIIGGLQYSTAGSDPKKIAAAKHRIYNAILALVAYLFIYSFLQWLVPGGIF